MQLVKGSCLLQEEAERCYNELVPSRKVASLVTARGNNLERVQNSRPVYIEVQSHQHSTALAP